MKRIAAWCLFAALACDAQWIRPKGPAGALVWGREDRIVFGEFIFGLTPKAPAEFTPAIPHLRRQP